MKLLKCVHVCALFCCYFFSVVGICFGFFSYSPMVSTCIEGGGIGFLSIMLMRTSSSCCSFSRFLCAQSPEQGSWVWEGGLRVSPNILSSVGWDGRVTGCPASGG